MFSRLGLVIAIVVCSGCMSGAGVLSRAKTLITTPSQKIEQSGNVATPVQTTVVTTQTEAPIPPGARVTIDYPPAPLVAQPASSSPAAPSTPSPVIKTTTSYERVVGPTNFIPPAAPHPVDVASSNIRIWLYIGMVVGIAAVIFGLLQHWPLVSTGGMCVSGACAIGLFVQMYPWIPWVIGIGVALKFFGPTLWLYLQRQRSTATATVTTSSPTPDAKT